LLYFFVIYIHLCCFTAAENISIFYKRKANFQAAWLSYIDAENELRLTLLLMSSNRLCSYDSSLSNSEDEESIMCDINDKDKQANSTQQRQKDERNCRDDHGNRESRSKERRDVGRVLHRSRRSRSPPDRTQSRYRNSSQSRICSLARRRIPERDDDSSRNRHHTFAREYQHRRECDERYLCGNEKQRSRNECNSDALIRQSISEKLMKKVNERKSLWKGNNSTAKKHWEEALSTCEDKKSMEKFRKLIGMKDGNGKEKEPGTSSTEDTSSGRKQEELFNNLNKQYEMARLSTHARRGCGLGYTSSP
ncbi:Arginine/serine-rich coiled-coil protein 2, partial [Trichinella papuae]